MRLIDSLKLHIDRKFLDDEDAMLAFNEFISNIPGRVLEIDFDDTKTNKQGITKDDSIYKFGKLLDANMIFLEFYNDRSQGMPTMGIYIDKSTPTITIKGSKVAQQYVLNFSINGGKVSKKSKLIK